MFIKFDGMYVFIMRDVTMESITCHENVHFACLCLVCMKKEEEKKKDMLILQLKMLM